LDAAVVNHFASSGLRSDRSALPATLLRTRTASLGSNSYLLVGCVIALCSERSIAVYVDDVNETYQRAVAVRTETVEAPTDHFYGDRRAMVRDRFGNMYPIVPPIES
jgi:hypothetical protein